MDSDNINRMWNFLLKIVCNCFKNTCLSFISEFICHCWIILRETHTCILLYFNYIRFFFSLSEGSMSMRLLVPPRAGQFAVYLTAAVGCYCNTLSPLPVHSIGKQRTRWGNEVILGTVHRQLAEYRTKQFSVEERWRICNLAGFPLVLQFAASVTSLLTPGKYPGDFIFLKQFPIFIFFQVSFIAFCLWYPSYYLRSLYPTILLIYNNIKL